MVPNLLSFGEVLKVTRNLLREGVSIRDSRTPVEALLDAALDTPDPEQLTELVRQKMSRQLTSAYKDPYGALATLRRSPQLGVLSLREMEPSAGVKRVESISFESRAA